MLATARPAEDQMTAVRTLSALILDDDEFIRTFVSGVLTQMGVKVLATAHNVESAMHVVNAFGKSIDLIVCDLHMPDCDGVEFITMLRASGLTSKIILLSSANASVRNGAAQLCHAYQLQLVASLRKPVQAADIAKAVATLSANGAKEVRLRSAS